MTAAPGPQQPDEVQALAAEIHEAWEFQYDQCDHGTYSGGINHGKPYEMCKLTAERIVSRCPAAPSAQPEPWATSYARGLVRGLVAGLDLDAPLLPEVNRPAQPVRDTGEGRR